MAALQQVLKMSIQAQGEDTNPPSEVFQPMGQENKEWLSGALSSFVTNATDLSKEMKTNLDKISALIEGEVTTDKMQQINEILEGITAYVDDLDLAKDFVHTGGHDVMLKCLNYKPLIMESCEILACIAQNNPKVQHIILQTNPIPIYLSLISDQSLGEIEKKKVLYALSCLCRGFEPAIQVFKSEKGIYKIIPFIENLDSLLATKAVFLIKTLVSEDFSLKEEILSSGMLEILINKLKEPRNATHEHILTLLYSCLTDNKDTIAFCKQPSTGLIQILNNYENQQEILEEEIQACREIKALLV
ncbi:hypothetical protein LOD99_13536 [Oopsacas minuta]|uniref:Hsp70-binding protein 1 n=1 Tax=Oopsacas minuta TaxID=111878 RepID=A0AAV7KKA5_9METZ|nr:hypothetical protein LOD99_13536 [Oopsacas minuta]